MNAIDNAKEIVSKKDYIIPLNFIRGSIVEYDIKSANITMLRKYGVLTEPNYLYLTSLDKNSREKEIGLMIKKKDTTHIDVDGIISNGIKEAKLKLVELNDIREDEIIRVANDAVYVSRSVPLQYTLIDDVNFVTKGIYLSFINLRTLQIFFNINNNDCIDIDVKGVGNNLFMHENFMLQFIGNLMYNLERTNKQFTMSYFNDFYQQYIELKLPIGFYRELNGTSMYRMKYSEFYLINIPEADKNLIDINYNLSLLRSIYSILVEIFSSEIKKR